MEYCILNDDRTIANIIVCKNDESAAWFYAVPSYKTARIGDIYDPPEPIPEPTIEELTLDLMSEHEERLCMLELMAT